MSKGCFIGGDRFDNVSTTLAVCSALVVGEENGREKLDLGSFVEGDTSVSLFTFMGQGRCALGVAGFFPFALASELGTLEFVGAIFLLASLFVFSAYNFSLSRRAFGSCFFGLLLLSDEENSICHANPTPPPIS